MKSNKYIIKNSAKCKVCGDEIQSAYTHDFVYCSCGNIFVDGGFEYLRRGGKGCKDMMEDTSQYGTKEEQLEAIKKIIQEKRNKK